MEQIAIIKRDGTTIQAYSQEPFCTPTSVVQSKALMSDDTVKITLRSSQAYTFGKGDKIVVNGEEYKIRTQPERTLQEENDFIYNLTFYGVMYDLMKCQFRNCGSDGSSTKAIFDLTFSLLDFAKVIIYNMNRDNPNQWVLDEANVPTTEPITISFSKQNCLQVLQDLCSEDKFNTEFRITQSSGVKTIHIGSFGTVVTPPSGASYFEYGKGNGLFELTEKKVDDRAIITRLWAEGGNKNIRSGYRDYSDRIQFPYPQRLNQRAHTLKDGTVIPAGSQTIGITSDAQRYMEDTALSQALGVEEETQTFDDIYPTRTGVISALGSTVYEFVDSSMDFDLNERDQSGNTLYLIEGTSAKLTFLTGLLAGQEFELAEYTHSTKTFKVKKYTDERGLSIPTEDTAAFRFAVGDKYKITDINMPDSYVQVAEEDLWYRALDYFNQAKQARVNYELTFDRSYFLDNMPADSDTCVFKVGDFVPVKDTRFNLQKNIRIQKVTRNLMLDHDYTLTLSDTTAISVVSQTVLDVIEHEKIIQINDLRDLGKAKRGWRTTEELRNMVYDTDGYFDNENIRPNSIDTNLLTVGSKSQQFVLTGVILAANVGGMPNQFAASAGVLSHLTILEDSVRSWNMAGSDVTLTDNGGYYVFAKCSKVGSTGVWYVTQDQLQVEPVTDPNNYYFLVGIIGSRASGSTFRDFTTTYGFTRINGSTITTGKIVTSDGNCYLDLDGNKFKIGNAARSVSFNENGDGKLVLKNVDIDSGAGDPVHLGVYRGVYQSGVVYYPNDEVSYTSGGVTATYRWTNAAAGSGHVPTDTNYWTIVAKGKDGVDGQDGEDGVDGDFFEYRFAVNGSRTTPPSLAQTTRNPAGWTTTQPTVGSLQYLWCTIAKIKGEDNTLLQNWSTPTRITPYDGVDGQDGEDGKSPVFAYRGDWSSLKTYIGTAVMVEGVKYNGSYYVSRIDAGTIPKGTLPTNTSYWNTFGGQFESVATDLLLANLANVGGLILKNSCLISQKGTINGVESTDYTNADFIPYLFLDGINGQSVIQGSIRTPFGRFDEYWRWDDELGSSDKLDNLYAPYGGHTLPFTWTFKNSGRRLTIVHNNAGVARDYSSNVLTAPSGKYFYEDGIAKTSLYFCNEIIELLGYGVGSTFYGWIVLDRHNIMTNKRYGHKVNALAMMRVVGTNSTAYFKKISIFDGTRNESVSSVTTKDEKTFSVSRTDTGIYTFSVPNNWFSNVNDMLIIATGEGESYGESDAPLKASVTISSTTSFMVKTSDDASRNDGSFNLIIINMKDWMAL